ncbi:CDC27 family protein [bacterium]|nr:CDC27 family protein [bacterium]MBU1994629.1 CDC27 family protein [bacterium]
MININELESRQLKYKIKSYIPHAVIIVSLSVIAFVSYAVLTSKSVANKKDELMHYTSNTHEMAIDTAKSMQTVEEKILSVERKTEIAKSNDFKMQNTAQEIQIQDKPINKITENEKNENEKMLLSPSLDFMKKINNNTLPYYENITEDENINISNSHKKAKEKAMEEKVELTEEPIVEESKKTSMNITRQNTHEDIKHVIARFKKNNNPALSLFVAKKYYEIGDYHKSYNYALITNEINNNIDASWIVFAKSLVKLNKKDMAIKTLKQYIEYSNSGQAKILLDEIMSGKFQ